MSILRHLPRLMLLALCLRSLSAQEFDLIKSRGKFLEGRYREVAEEAEAAVKNREGHGEDWRILWLQSLLMTGRYADAQEVTPTALRSQYYSIRLKLLAHQVYRQNGNKEKAAEILEEIEQMVSYRRAGFSDPEEVIAVGQGTLLLGADPRLVLDNFFEPIIKKHPDTRLAYIAKSRLALDKHDYGLAAKAANAGLMKFVDDIELLGLLAEAFAPSDRKAMIETVEKILEKNENYTSARILLVDHLVDGENYEEAEKQLALILEVNPNHPEAHAYRAVLAHLRNDADSENAARAAALKFWATNPAVDHLIGKKLSQKYRFAEGSKYQRTALQHDAGYLPAKVQLASDLLRLGDESPGWSLAEQVAESDPYDVGAYNLVTLRDTLKKYTTLTNQHFVVRMRPREADIFGSEVLALLEDARTKLTKKYGLELNDVIAIEIFDAQKDFAIRTFGMPGGEGFLAVCFGDVITANSPTAQQMNWKSVLWHEFAHVVTLNITRNKMPRWLSEGISVYEERLADPRWGEKMEPAYRRMIADGEMKKVGELSSAFLAPPTPLHVQFAYYQSSLVVEFLVSKYGLDPLRAVLRALGEGTGINEALAQHCEPLPALEKDFEAFAKSVAREFGNDVIWAKPKRTPDGEIDKTWEIAHAENFWVIREKASAALDAENFEEAEKLLRQGLKIYPTETGSSSGYGLLAKMYRDQKRAQEEHEILKQWVKHDYEAEDALIRLIELETTAKNWSDVLKYARMLEEINPARPALYKGRALAAEQAGQKTEAVTGWKKLLLLNPQNPAEVHFSLANLLVESSPAEARRHLLLCLEEAPRFRAAHQLLLKLSGPIAQ